MRQVANGTFLFKLSSLCEAWAFRVQPSRFGHVLAGLGMKLVGRLIKPKP